MPPPVALLFCTVFVGFLLRLDHKQAQGLSRSLWIPSIWALVAFSKPLAIWFGSRSESSMEAGSPLDRAFLIVLLGLAILVLSRRGFDWLGAIRENRWAMLLVGFMLISILWSSIPLISFKRWTRDFIVVMMAFMILSESDPRRALLTILRRLTYVLIPYSLLLIKYFPKYGIQYGRWSGARMWVGVGLQKNHLALLCIISAVFLVWTLIRRWSGRDIPVVKYQTLIEIFLLILIMLLLMGPRVTLTYSATSTVVLALAMFALSGLYLLRNRGSALSSKALKIFVITIIIYGSITPFLGRLSILDVSSVLNRDATLTGRSDIWASLVPFALNRPVLGHGFGGFWTSEMRAIAMSNAHNGYLDVILNLGFAGLVFVSIFLISCCQKAHRTITEDFDWGVLFVCYLLMAVVHNIAESTISTLTSSLTAVVLFLSVSAPKAFSGLETVEERAPRSEESES
jgi:exopolysaccharide production protein ExoQ